MNKLEVFFDYTCPYCEKGHRYLAELLPEFPELSVEFRPCESHPRPEMHGAHSDLCIRGVWIIREQGADERAYHNLIFRAKFVDKIDIEDPKALAEYVSSLVDPDVFLRELESGSYIDELNQANINAWETYQMPAVPSYRMNGKQLDSIPGVGVPKEMLKEWIQSNLK